MRRALGLVVALLPTALIPATAQAFRTSQDSQANQSSGITGRIAFEPLPVPFALHRGSDDVGLDPLRLAVTTAFQTWTEPACSGLEVRDDGMTTTPAIYGDDRNVLEWVETGWSGRGFGAFTIGVTTNQFLRVGGRWSIDESDMELNGEGYTWVIDGGEPDADPVDVQGLVVHEAGHFLGLLHTCEQTAFDGAPACVDFPDTPTMYPRYTGEEQRTLSADDVDGICFLYPTAALPDAGPVAVDAGSFPSADAGATVGDAGASSDAGAAGTDAALADAGIVTRRDDGCGCRAAPSSRAPVAMLGLALLLAMRRRASR